MCPYFNSSNAALTAVNIYFRSCMKYYSLLLESGMTNTLFSTITDNFCVKYVRLLRVLVSPGFEKA